MASLLKNQILKHLSKFTKNLSSDKINLSTLKGEGELSNLELNEDVLTQLLELPTWLRITKAICNRVAVKIQWTKLKSQPICLYLDEVIVETETCEVPRPPNSLSQQLSGGKYGFVDRVMDGIFIHVNSVVVKLTSHKFQASLQLSRVKVQSMTPTWQTPSDLRSTRIRDASLGEILLFKEIEWQTTRIEATALEGNEEQTLTPLRLIANQAKIRIAVKKRLSDSAIISSRLTLLLDDLLWVLTITQLKAAILYANSLKELIERSARQSKTLAAEKLKKQGHMPDHSARHQQHQAQQRSVPVDRQESSTAKYFSRFDVSSTSYHLVTSRFDLHLCDDSNPDEEENRHWKINGGSMQITFYKLSLDLYPFHPAGGERKSWHRYSNGVGTRNLWVQKLFAQFREDAVLLRKACESSSLTSSLSAPSLISGQPGLVGGGGRGAALKPGSSASARTSPVHGAHPNLQPVSGSRSTQASPSHQGQRSTRLLESCFVFKVEDMTVYMVNTPTHRRTGNQKLLASDKKQLHLPPDMSMVHVEFTDYFFPEGLEYPVPSPNLYVLVNPVRITLDFLSLLWSNVFLLTLSRSFNMDFSSKDPSEHVDIKVELLMPRVIVPAEDKVEGQPDRPDALQLQISKLMMSNCRTDEHATRDCLQSLLDEYEVASIFTQSDFPCEESQAGQETIPKLFYHHAVDEDNPFLHQDVKSLLNQEMKASSSEGLNQTLMPSPVSQDPEHQLACDSLKRLASADVWAIHAEQVWLEFLGIANSRNRPVPFVEAVPVTIWVSMVENVEQQRSTHFGGAERFRDSSAASHQKDEVKGTRSAPSQSASQQDTSRSCALSQSVMPSLGSSPPICDMKNGHQNYNRGSNGHQSYNRDSSPDFPLNKPTHQRPQVSGEHNCGDGSRPNKAHHKRTDSPCDEKSRSSRYGHPYPSSGRADRTRSESPSTMVDVGGGRSDESGRRDVGRKQQQSNAGHRQQKPLRREDSRSVSSPPPALGGRKRDEWRGRGERRRSQSGARLTRQSSSSSSDRRDLEGGYHSGDGWREEGRTSGEGQVSSEWGGRFEEDMQRVRERRGGGGNQDDLYDSGSRDHGEADSSGQSHSRSREFAKMNYRRNRQSSSSSSELGPTNSTNAPSQGGSKERLSQPRAGSRDRRDRSVSHDRQEVDWRGPRDGSREQDRDYKRDRRRRGKEESEKGNPRAHHSPTVATPTREAVGRHGNGPQDYDNDGGYGLAGQGRARDLKRLDGVSRSRESSLSRAGREQPEAGRRRRCSSSHSDDQQDSFSAPRSNSRQTGRGPVPHDNNSDRYREKSGGDVERDPRVERRMSRQEYPDEFNRCFNENQDGRTGVHADDHPYRAEQRSERGGLTRSNTRPTPEGGRSQEEYGLKADSGHLDGTQSVNKICVLPSIQGKMRVQVTHFQYLFLMRLLESFAAFQVDLSVDLSVKVKTESGFSSSSSPRPHHQPGFGIHHHHLPQKEHASPSQNPTHIVIPLVLKEMELAVVCPYQMHQRTFSDDFSVISPFLAGMTTGQDAVFGDDGETTCFPQLVGSGAGGRTKDDFNLQRVHQSISFKSNSSGQIDHLTHLGLPASDSHHRGRGPQLDSGSAHQQAFPTININQPTTVNGSLFHGADLNHGKDGILPATASHGQMGHRDYGVERESRVSSASSRQPGSRSSKSGKSDVKKTLTSAFSSFTDKLKTKMDVFDDGHGNDDLDSMSIRTDTSDDDFEHMSLEDLEEVPAFFHEHPPPDLQPAEDSYSEIVDPGDSVSMYAESSTTKGKEMVYIVLFKLDHTELMTLLEDTGTLACIQLVKLATVQLGNICYDDFQSRFSSARGYVQEDLAKVPTSLSSSSQPKPTSVCPIKLKYVLPANDPSSQSCGQVPEPGSMAIHAEDFNLRFKMSGLTCLSDFVEDEKLPEVVPMTLNISNLLLVLEEDRPPANITSPGALPLNICIRQLRLERTRDGMMYLSGSHSPDVTPFDPRPAKTPSSQGVMDSSSKPVLVHATTSPMPALDGTMALLMASQNEAVLLRRQLEEVRRANRLYEHQILQWREMQDASVAAAGGSSSSSSANMRSGFAMPTRKHNFLSDAHHHTGSPSSSSAFSEATPSTVGNHVPQPTAHDALAREEMERDNLRLQQRIIRLEDDLLTVSKEKESLLQTLQLLQDELLASERKQRARSK